jgi:enamine deaminase RidA (YjgF/YER057c/UK114 family)
MNDIDKRLAELGIALPAPAKPVANYVPFVRSGNLVFVSGQGPMQDGKVVVAGKLGGEVSPENGARAARLCAINVLAHLREACGGDLSRVRRIVKVLGFVNSTPDFADQPKVINGASDLFVEVFGEAGRHARSAVGAPALPLNIAVEVEAVAEVA